MQEDAILGCKLSKSLSFSQDEELYIATSDTKNKMEEDYAPFVDKVLNDISFVPSMILDLGCGPGYIARRLNEVLPNASILGIDKSSVMINHAQAVFKNASLNKNYLQYMIADSEKLPYANGIFDLIILKGTFKCLEDKTASLKEMYRVLCPGGEIFIYEFRKNIPEDEFYELTKNMKPQKVNSLRRKLNCSLDIFEYNLHLYEAGMEGLYKMEADGLDLKIRIIKKSH